MNAHNLDNKRFDDNLEALQEAGYKTELLTEPPVAGAKAAAIVEGAIVEFWMDLYMKVWHRVEGAGARAGSQDAQRGLR